MSIWTDALDDIYASDIAVDGTLSLLTESIRVIDKTDGIDLALLGKAGVQTIVPAAVVQRSVLTAAGVTNMASLIQATITLNGVTWRIANHAYRVQPGGERDGEVFLILRKA